MSTCVMCKQNKPLYKCPVCWATGHVDLKTKTLVLHAPALDPKILVKGKPVAMAFPSHFDCEFAKPITQIDLNNLIRVEVKP